MDNNTCVNCRRAGQKLFLKGARCLSPKCAMIKRNYRPGQNGKTPRRLSEYGRQLQDKQIAAGMYGINNNQFKRYYQKASKQLGATNEAIVQLLERRLDNVIYRLGLSLSRPMARMLVKDHHILVNGKKVTIPSYLVKAGDEISFAGKDLKKKTITEILELEKYNPPAWLELKKDKYQGVVKQLPNREEIEVPFDEKLVVEFYSR